MARILLVFREPGEPEDSLMLNSERDVVTLDGVDVVNGAVLHRNGSAWLVTRDDSHQSAEWTRFIAVPVEPTLEIPAPVSP